MRHGTSKSEAMVLSQKRVDCPLQVGEESLPQVEEFKYFGVLFMSEGKMEWEIDTRIGVGLTVMQTEAVCYVEERAESEGKAFNWQVNLCPNSHLWS